MRVVQSFFQPSTAYDFLVKEERNKYIYLKSFFFVGFAVGILLAIPHYFIYKELIQSILLVFTAAAPLAVAGLVAFKSTVEKKNEFAFESVFIMAGIVVFVYAGVFAGAIISTKAGAFAAAAAVAGAVAVAVAVASPRESTYLYSFTFMGITMVILSILGGKIEKIEIYEVIIYPLTFLIGYLLVSSFEFQKDINNFKENFKDKLFTDIDIPQLKFARSQRLSWIWTLLFALLIWVLIYFQWKQKLHIKIFIAAGFALSFFILRIPDYLICLPIWFYQRRKILNTLQSGKAMMSVYNNSLLFKHEMIYFQLPGLHKIMASFACDKEIGLKGALNQIDHLYYFTFQQKQAVKSLIALGKDSETAHRYLHLLLEKNDLPLLRCLYRESPLAKFYLMLFEDKNKNEVDLSDDKQASLLFKWFPVKIRLKEQCKSITVPLEVRIKEVINGMKEKAYRFNDEMINTLEIAYQLLTADTLEDFYTGYEELRKVKEYPVEITYFTHLQKVVSDLDEIKKELIKIEKAERFRTKLSYLMEKKEAFNSLLKPPKYKEKFYEPFKSLWQNVFHRCGQLVEKEIERLQNSAVLDVQLENKDIFVSDEQQPLIFNIYNKGQKEASEITIMLQPVSREITFISDKLEDIPPIEAGGKKEITLLITAPSPVNEAKIRLFLTFTDRTKEKKQVPFSFDMNVKKKSTDFKYIKNCYLPGNPLPGDSILYFGRNDALKFINKHIITDGGQQTIVCHGLKRSGKTTLLNRIAKKGLSDKSLMPVFIDMQGVVDEKHFYCILAREINKKLSIPAPGHTIDNYRLFEAYLEEIKPKLAKRIVLLMMDEFERLQELVEDKKISKYIFDHIRHMMQHEQKLLFLLCGSNKLKELRTEHSSVIFNNAYYYRIGNLKEKDTKDLVTKPVEGQLTYDDLALRQIFKITNGQPHVTQLICHTIIRNLNEIKKRNDVVISDVDDAVDRIISTDSDNFSLEIWKGSTNIEQYVLKAAAQELTNKQLDYIDAKTVFEKIQVQVNRLTIKEVENALDGLVSQEVLDKVKNGYFFPVNLLRKWIAFKDPLIEIKISNPLRK